jgi:hypothetical protein
MNHIETEKTMKRRIAVSSIGIAGVVTLCLLLTACPVTSADCANAVNKYANALSAFQDGEISLHNTTKLDNSVPPQQVPLISDATHVSIIHAEQAASKAGHDLDAAVGLANNGADPSQYVSLAQQSFDAMVTQINIGDVATQQKLMLLAQGAGDALKNAISLIQALRAAKAPAGTPAPAPAPAPTPAPANPAPATNTSQSGHHLPLWAFLVLPLGAAAFSSAAGILQLLTIITQLEPVAFQLILSFATSLKGKSEADIVALNEALFNKVDTTAAAELVKAGALKPKT